MPSELERVRHEVRNAVLGLQQGRRVFLKATSEYARAQLRYYDMTSEILVRIESALMGVDEPLPEDAI